MVNELTLSTFNGDFRPVLEHGHLLFTKRALSWYWDYRLQRQNQPLAWPSICSALKHRFCGHLSDLDIQDLIRNRKQKENESFDEFYYDVLNLCGTLEEPLSESKLVAILRKNLKPQLCKDLFFFNIPTVANLRQMVLRREIYNSTRI